MDRTRDGPVSEYYRDKTILVTGACGSIGKVLIWKLLLSCSGIQTIYILIRPKKGKDPQSRLNELLQTPIFDNFKKDDPQALEKVKAISGDIGEPGLGLSEKDERKLTTSVHIIFHVAALVKFDATLKDAVDANVGGTQKLLELATKMPNLQAFVHTSTAYCICDVPELGERVYEGKQSPQEIMRLVSWMKPEMLRSIEKDLTGPHPNTYTYSKRLAENLVAGYHSKLPVVIARPAIVGPSAFEPFPGWTDNMYNSVIGSLLAVGKGVLRVVLCNLDCHLDVTTVDIVCNSLIAVAWKIGSHHARGLEEVPVYTLGTLEMESFTFGDLLEMGMRIKKECPYSVMMWYPFVIVTSNLYVCTALSFLLQWIPAYSVDALLSVLGYKPFMVQVQRKIRVAVMASGFFALRDWNFAKNNILNVRDDLTEEDKCNFKVTCRGVTKEEYFRNAALVVRWYLMKEDPGNIPMAKRRLKMLYLLHCTVKYSFWLYVGYILLRCFVNHLYF